MALAMKHFPLVLVAVLLFGTAQPAPGARAGQIETESEPYQSQLVPWTITASGPTYAITDVALEEYPHGHGERVHIAHSAESAFVEIGFFDDGDTPEETIDLMLRDFDSASRSLVVLESGSVDTVSYALARFELERRLFGYLYIEVSQDVEGNVDLAESIYSLAPGFIDHVSTARSEISLDGRAFLADPLVDLELAVSRDADVLAATPEPVATPRTGTHTFRTNETELDVREPIGIDFPLTSGPLEVIFLSSAHGYGVVGFIHQDADSAGDVISGIFLDAPSGAEAPVELSLVADESGAVGVYRVQFEGTTRAMVIHVTHVEDGLWTVEAMAVTESEFAEEFATYQGSVTFDGEPLFGEIDTEHILTIIFGG